MDGSWKPRATVQFEVDGSTFERLVVVGLSHTAGVLAADSQRLKTHFTVHTLLQQGKKANPLRTSKRLPRIPPSIVFRRGKFFTTTSNPEIKDPHHSPQ